MTAPVFESVTKIIDKLADGNTINARVSMRYETLRLCTFRNYPVNKPFRIKLAKAGFYYASNDDEVICYCCAKRASNWRESDDPMNAHRCMAPSCSYLLRNSEVNVPVTSESYTGDGRLERILASLDDDNTNTQEDRQSVITSARRSNLQDSTPGRRSHPIHPLLSDTSFGINLNFETEGDPLDTSFSVEEPGHSANLNNSSNQLRGAKTTSKRTTTEHGAASNHRELAAAAVSNDPSSSVKEQRQSTDVKPKYHQTRKEETATKHASKDTDNKIRVSGQTPTEIISHAADPSLRNGLQSLGGHHDYAPRSAQQRTSINSSLKLANGNESQSFLSLPSDTGTRRKNPVNKSLLKEKRRLEAENQSLKEEITCKQCHEHEIEMVFLPCGHVLTCESCGTKARTCFSCKGVIKGIAKFYSA